jgi:hypothetical protein
MGPARRESAGSTSAAMLRGSAKRSDRTVAITFIIAFIG